MEPTNQIRVPDGVGQPLLSLVLSDLHLGQLVALGLNGLLQVSDVQLLQNQGRRIELNSFVTLSG
jgi:hypothetical protein